MGKLSKVIGPVGNIVEHFLRISGVTLTFHRPEYDEEGAISAFLRTGKDKEHQQDPQRFLLQATAKVMKLLCDDPDLRDEDEVAIQNDLMTIPAADRNSILPFYATLVRAGGDDILDAMAKQLLSAGTTTQS